MATRYMVVAIDGAHDAGDVDGGSQYVTEAEAEAAIPFVVERKGGTLDDYQVVEICT